MKTEMKKNNNMFLALAVVAALAMVSFAGIALADDSAADERLDPIGQTDGATMATASGTIDWKFYVDDSTLEIMGETVGFNIGYVIIPGDITLSGTISIGTYDAAKDEFTAIDTLELKNVSGATITMLAASSEDLGIQITLFGVGDYDSPFDLAKIKEYMDENSVDFLQAVEDLVMVEEEDIYNGSAVSMSGEINVLKGKALMGAVAPGSLAIIKELAKNGFDMSMVYDIANVLRVSSGKATAGNMSLDMTGIFGALVTAADGDEAAGISLTAIGALWGFDYETHAITMDSEIIISGEASVIYPDEIYDLANMFGLSEMYNLFAPIGANVIVEEDAVLTVGDKMPENVESVWIEIPAAATDVIAVAVYGDNLVRNGIVKTVDQKQYVVFYELEIGVTYNVFLFVDEAAYYAPITVTGEPGDYKYNLGSTKVKGGLDEATGGTSGAAVFSAFDTALDAFKFDAEVYNFIAAFDADFVDNYGSEDMGLPFLASAEDGVITFLDDVKDDRVVVILASKKDSGNPYYVYVGTVSTATAGIDAFATNDVEDLAAGVLKVNTKTTALAANEIRVGPVDSGTSVSIFAPVFCDVTIKGTVKILYNSEYVYGMFVPAFSEVNFEGKGILEYEIEPTQYPDAPVLVSDTFDLPILGVTNVDYFINAAYYFVNEGPESAPTKTTYYYTTLANALENSDFITLLGIHEITDELTLDGPADKITVVIGDNAELYVGIEGTDDTEPISGTLNVPTKTEVVVTGHYEVIYGQVVYDKSSKDWKPVSEPLADVRKVTDEKHILADITTGLNIAVAGDTVELIRGDAADPVELVDNATVKDGVTFKDAGYTLCIPVKKTLTVVGEFISTGDLCIEGTLSIQGYVLIDSNSVGNNPKEVDLDGTIFVASGATLDVGKTKASYIGSGVSGAFGVIVVDGTMNVLASTDGISVAELYITGTLEYAKTTADETVYVDEYLEIGAAPTLSTELENNAKVVGVIDVFGTATIYGIPTEFDAEDIFDQAVFDLATVFVIGDDIENVYATQYGDGNITYLYAKELKDVKLVGWFYDPMFVKPFGPSDKVVIGGTVADPAPYLYGEFEPRMYTIKLSHTQGANWLVNNIHQGASADYAVAYGTEVWINVDVIAGYAGTPAITKDGSSYNAGTKFTVTGDSTFAIKEGSIHVATDDGGDDGLTLIEILLIVIVVIIGVIAIVVALRLLRS